MNSLRAGPLEHRGGEKRAGKGIPTHGKFSGTLPPHEASPLDRASVAGVAFQRGRPHRCGLPGDGTCLGASRVGLTAAVCWGTGFALDASRVDLSAAVSAGAVPLRFGGVGLETKG
ncbi:hypothetical protein Acsp05_68580 [Actinokineospora sp. NBRC 105648]|nr:hypothetical protein Acsp05_68580 [Actinokineospora sp. NBRC 105648]